MKVVMYSAGILSLDGGQVVSFTLAVVAWVWVGARAGMDALFKTKSFNLGRNRTTFSRMTSSYCISFVTLKEKATWELPLGVYGKITGRWKWCVRMWTGFVWLRIGTSALLLWPLFRNFVFYKSWDSCSAEGLCSVELVNCMWKRFFHN